MGKKLTSEHLKILQEGGFAVKPQLMDYVQHQEWEKKGIVQHWRCTPCNQNYLAPMPVTGVDCSKQHVMRLVWQTGEV